MGYAEKNDEKFFLSLLRRRKQRRRGSVDLDLRKGRVVHGASLALLLIFCKQIVGPCRARHW